MTAILLCYYALCLAALAAWKRTTEEPPYWGLIITTPWLVLYEYLKLNRKPFQHLIVVYAIMLAAIILALVVVAMEAIWG